MDWRKASNSAWAPHEGGELTGRQRLQTRPRGTRPQELEHVDGGRHALDGHGTERLHLDQRVDQVERLSGDQHRSRRRHLLHPRRQVGRLAHRGVVHMEAAVDPPHDHVPGVEAHPDVHRKPMRALDLVTIAAHASLASAAPRSTPARRDLHARSARRTAP